MALNRICRSVWSTLLSPFKLLRALLFKFFAKEPDLAGEENSTMPKYYHDDEKWADVVPLPQDDGGLHPLAAIAYSDEYSEAMSYLRAVMAKNEFSKRVLELTEHIISMNAAHYTVWLYRAETVSKIGRSLQDEIAWLNPTALKHLKNYQIWQHRQTIIDALGSPDGEPEFIDKMLKQDSKNYHVWSYRQFLVKRFDLWDKPEELEWTHSMIEADVRNNSAWNHRHYLVFGSNRGKPSKDIVDREIEYSKAAIRKAPQNQSPWNYLIGMVRKLQMPLSTLKDFALEFADVQAPDEVHSSHALDLLADIYSEEKNTDNAAKALDLLATRYDPIRAGYWNYRKNALRQHELAA